MIDIPKIRTEFPELISSEIPSKEWMDDWRKRMCGENVNLKFALKYIKDHPDHEWHHLVK